VTDLEEKTEIVLAKLTSIFLNMTQLEDMFSIETPTFRLVYKKTNFSSLPFKNMSSENNSICLPGFINFALNNYQANFDKQMTLKVNI
jgi:hypothetical protein